MKKSKNYRIRKRRERALGISLGTWRLIKKKVFKRDGKCVWCGSKENLTCDHIIALKDGGTNDYSNLRTLCRSCHEKHNIEAWHLPVKKGRNYVK